MTGTVIRIVVLVLLSLLAGTLVAVLRLYWLAWRRVPGRAGLTPLHVALVAAGLLLYAGALAWAVIEALRRPTDGPAVIRTFMYGAGSLLLLGGLWVIGAVQARRVHFCRSRGGRDGTQTVVATESGHVIVERDPADGDQPEHDGSRGETP